MVHKLNQHTIKMYGPILLVSTLILVNLLIYFDDI